MGTPALDPAPTDQHHDEDHEDNSEQEATRPVAVIRIPKARPHAHALEGQEDEQTNQQELHPRNKSN